MPAFIYPEWDVATILFLQKYPFLIFIAKMISSLSMLGVMLLTLYLYFTYKRQGIRALLYITLCAFIITLFKNVFHHPRPFWVFPEVIGFSSSRDFGFPSGHAMISTLFIYLSLFANKNRLKYIALSVLFVLIVSLSRATLGVHFITQTIYGSLFGIFVSLCLFFCEKTLFSYFNKKSFLIKANILTFIALIIGGTALYLYLKFALFYKIPLEWEMNAGAYTHNKSLVGVSFWGIFSGFLLFCSTIFSLLWESVFLRFIFVPFKQQAIPKKEYNGGILLVSTLLVFVFILLYKVSPLFFTIMFSLFFPIIYIIVLPQALNNTGRVIIPQQSNKK